MLESALGRSESSILITGLGVRESRMLVESLWNRPPKGFALIPVPCHGANADQIAARTLEMTRTVPVRDAEAGLARMMRTQSIRGARPVLVLDDLDAISPEALLRLRSIADGSRVAVQWIAAQSGARPSEAALRLPKPVRVLAVDASRLWKTGSAIPSPRAADIAQRPASSEPPAPAAEPVVRPIRAGAMPAREAAPARVDPPRAPPRAPARRLRPQLPRVRRLIGATVVGCIALAVLLLLLVERGPVFFAWATEESVTSLASARDSFGPWLRSATWTAERALDVPRQLWAEYRAEEPREESEPAVAAAPPAAVPEPEAEVPEPEAAAPGPEPAAPTVPPIQVSINSDPWSMIEVDGADFGSTPLSIDLVPGPHQFRAKMADGRIVEREIDVSEERSEIAFR
jgi:hypothetical protein